MGTSSSAGKSSEELGIVPRVVHELFDLMKSRDETHTYVLHTQFIEVYQDDIFDLLCTIPRGRADRPIPQIKEGRGDRIEVENVTKLDSKCAEDCLDALERGSASRVTGSTNMNAASSRSHAIFTLQLSQKVRESDDLGVSNDEFITSKFHFVDLSADMTRHTHTCACAMVDHSPITPIDLIDTHHRPCLGVVTPLFLLSIVFVFVCCLVPVASV